jgi:hypothetical protein
MTNLIATITTRGVTIRCLNCVHVTRLARQPEPWRCPRCNA